MKNVQINPISGFTGKLQIPGDKSISHRAVMLSALAEGTSTLTGLLRGQDVLATISCFQEMGVNIEVTPEKVIVHGVGLKGLKAPAKVLDCGNSGTTLRLMMGILAAQPFTSRLTGDSSLNRRPMERVSLPLQKMGAHIEELRASPTERIVKIQGKPLRGIEYELPMASAQVKSAILLAGLFASGTTRILEKMPSRNHSELMLAHKGVSLSHHNGVIELQGAQSLKAEDLTIPGDISSAAFFLVGGCLGKNSRIKLESVGINPTRTGILEVLQAMGAQVILSQNQNIGGEEVADIEVQSSELRGTQISGRLIPRLIDEIPILAVAATFAKGSTEIHDAQELRVKETDRIQTIYEEMSKNGSRLETFSDGFQVSGADSVFSADYQSHGDHRIAMSMAIASSFAEKPSQIRDVECIETSYPLFFQDFSKLGGLYEWI